MHKCAHVRTTENLISPLGGSVVTALEPKQLQPVSSYLCGYLSVYVINLFPQMRLIRYSVPIVILAFLYYKVSHFQLCCNIFALSC